jgi:hypothetical protein
MYMASEKIVTIRLVDEYTTGLKILDRFCYSLGQSILADSNLRGEDLQCRGRICDK